MKANSADPLQMKTFSTGLNSVHVENAITFYIPSTILEIQLDSQLQVLDVFNKSLTKRKFNENYENFGPFW